MTAEVERAVLELLLVTWSVGVRTLEFTREKSVSK